MLPRGLAEQFKRIKNDSKMTSGEFIVALLNAFVRENGGIKKGWVERLGDKSWIK